MSGDLEIGATGTVTDVQGTRVYAFGHPFYGLGPTQFPMTRAYVHTLLPSLANSMKIASTGEVIGTVQQDRATTIAGTLGPGPTLIPLRISLTSDRGTKKTFNMAMVNDQLFTPLLAYLSIVNTLTSYERQNGVASYVVRGTAAVKGYGGVAFEDLFTGDQPSIGAAAYVVAPINVLLRNAFQDVELERLDLEIDASEQPRSATIERVWIDGARVKPGTQVDLKMLLRTYRGEEITRTVPVEIPPSAHGSLSVMVTDGTRLSQWEARELQVQPLQTRDLPPDAPRAQQRQEEQPAVRAVGRPRPGRGGQGRIALVATALGDRGPRIRPQRRELPAPAERRARRMGHRDRARRHRLAHPDVANRGMTIGQRSKVKGQRYRPLILPIFDL